MEFYAQYTPLSQPIMPWFICNEQKDQKGHFFGTIRIFFPYVLRQIIYEVYVSVYVNKENHLGKQ